MRTCAFLTTSGLEGFVVDDELALVPLRRLGWDVRMVEWRAPNDWNAFDAVVIRSTWDYMDDPGAFVSVLEAVEASDAVLLNSLDIVRWNLEKTYLRDLAARGVDVVPSLWGDGLSASDVRRAFSTHDTDEVVVKPVVGANARDAFRVSRARLASVEGELESTYDGRAFMIQPFVDSVLDDGEFSLFFFDGAFSHAIQKRPRARDFRVQEEHGASIEAVEPEPRLLKAAARALSVLPSVPLYARVDLVRHRSGFAIMELELIEPSLYLRMHPTAADRFARAFDGWMARGGPASGS